ncbi:class I SAM-dependent methyltransferase [Isoalcanivorax beigongshangi]|uniref:Class I SAM-dependent methyltransferase n=1 Tax=Isoalcanivorax beigongshangi TaxID=3238810 RepID=A0ABV4AFT4_9GAMM
MSDTDHAHIAALAAQLQHPRGDHGRKIGDMMHASNLGMTRACFDALALSGPARLLEIGHGNGAHVSALLATVAGLHYHGLDVSELMHDEARQHNAAAVAAGQAQFTLQHGDWPFEAPQFDAIMAVNVLYFIQPPEPWLAALKRCLVPGGRLALAVGSAAFMQNLPFTAHGFRLYEGEQVADLLSQVGLREVESRRHREWVPSKVDPGGQLERTFDVVVGRL